MKLFQSIFGRGETLGRYPESLIEAAMERAVDGTDSRLRLLPGYRRRLREPVIRAADHVVALVDAIPSFSPAGRQDHAADPRLGALFASAAEMLELFGRDAHLQMFLATPEGRGAGRVTALLLAERGQKGILGMDLAGDQVRRDVPQVAVSFGGHRLLDPCASEAETRRQLKRRAFDHLLSLALTRIAQMRVERADLVRGRDLLRRKLAALERGGWTFESAPAERPDPAALTAELDAITAQLAGLGTDDGVLRAHLEVVVDVLSEPARQLWRQELDLCLDAMNIQRDPRDRSGRRLAFQELCNARGARAVLLPLALLPQELPPREDLVTAAQRYLY